MCFQMQQEEAGLRGEEKLEESQRADSNLRRKVGVFLGTFCELYQRATETANLMSRFTVLPKSAKQGCSSFDATLTR